MNFKFNGRKYRTTAKTAEALGALILGGGTFALTVYTILNLEALSTIL